MLPNRDRKGVGALSVFSQTRQGVGAFLITVLPAETKGHWNVIRVLIVSHEDAVVARLGKELAVAFGSQGNASADIDTGFGNRIGRQDFSGRD
jgi:hypothetical protein